MLLISIDVMSLKVKRKEFLCFRVDFDMELVLVVESVNFDVRLSLLFLVYSMDSGVDICVEDFLVDFVSFWLVDEDFGLNE